MAVVMSKGANTPVPQAPVRLRLHWRHGAGVPDARTAALLVTGDGRVAHGSSSSPWWATAPSARCPGSTSP